VTATPGHDSCGCPETDGKTYHQRGTCTDPAVAALDWYADGPASAAVTPGQADEPWRAAWLAFREAAGFDYAADRAPDDELDAQWIAAWKAAAKAATAVQEQRATDRLYAMWCALTEIERLTGAAVDNDDDTLSIVHVRNLARNGLNAKPEPHAADGVVLHVNGDLTEEQLAVLREDCQTPGAVFTSHITDTSLTVTVDYGRNLSLDADAAGELEAAVHTSLELALAPYWDDDAAPREQPAPALAGMPPGQRAHHLWLETRWPDMKSEAIARDWELISDRAKAAWEAVATGDRAPGLPS
jgi:hypothetical protein